MIIAVKILIDLADIAVLKSLLKSAKNVQQSACLQPDPLQYCEPVSRGASKYKVSQISCLF